MTLSAIVHEAAVGGPATHAFLVGIGHYPHLAGGGGLRANLDFGLGQLDSTTASARRLADWFITEFDCPERPLSTVSLILSEPGAGPATYTHPETNASIPVPRGTKVETRDALFAALAKVAGPDDQLIFYLAAHGLAGGANNFYLLRDYGADPNGPFDGMINYSRLMAMMRAQLPTRQFLVFDACRDVQQIVAANQDGGDGLLFADPKIRLDLGPVQQCAIQSTELDGSAYGKHNSPSVCAQAFERAIGGAAGKRSIDGWNITTARMWEAMRDFQTLGFGPHAGLVQTPDATAFHDFPIRRLPRKPLVPVFMKRRDGGSLQGAAVTCSANDIVVLSEPSVKDRYWEGALDIGEHRFDVVLGDGTACAPVVDAVSPTHLPIDLDIL